MRSDGSVPRETALHAIEMTAAGGPSENAAPAILDAAVRCFDEKGYDAASINEIAKAAATSKSLVSYYFPSKRALASAVIDLAYPGGVFFGVARPGGDPLDDILWFVEHIATNVVHTPLARVAMDLQDLEVFRFNRAHGRFAGWLARFADYLDEAKDRGDITAETDTVAEARFLLSGVVGLIAISRSTSSRLTLVDDALKMTSDRLDLLASNEGRASARAQ